jgi:hypothetical protein
VARASRKRLTLLYGCVVAGGVVDAVEAVEAVAGVATAALAAVGGFAA